MTVALLAEHSINDEVSLSLLRTKTNKWTGIAQPLPLAKTLHGAHSF